MPTCPACQGIVSSIAVVCPHCRKDLPDSDAVEDRDRDESPVRMTASPRVNPAQRIGTRQLLLSGLAILAAGIVWTILVYRDAGHRSNAVTDLRQIGLGLITLQQDRGQLPPFPPPHPAIPREPQSWMTDLLPYNDQAPLYFQLDFRVPWDATPIQTGFTYINTCYVNPAIETPKQNRERFAPAHYAGNAALITPTGGRSLSNMTDGASHTLLAGTVDDGIKAWADPSNVRDAALGFQGGPDAFGSPFRGVVLGLMADGSVRPLSKQTNRDVARRLGDPADGEAAPKF